MRHDYYRPVAMARLTAGLEGAGTLTALKVRLSGHSILATLTPFGFPNRVDLQFQEGFLEDMPYEVPHYLADYAMRNTHVPVGFWRCVNHTQNCFFRESFIDELAHAAGADPYAYRRGLVGKPPKARGVLWAVRGAGGRGERGVGPPPGPPLRHERHASKGNLVAGGL